ncbi:hypothetical protein BJV77DRAFT_1152313 [Russula vinacea]|nr:hypothetical protein BJV77DRAFT_1152313 [Russula vinacea]
MSVYSLRINGLATPVPWLRLVAVSAVYCHSDCPTHPPSPHEVENRRSILLPITELAADPFLKTPAPPFVAPFSLSYADTLRFLRQPPTEASPLTGPIRENILR